MAKQPETLFKEKVQRDLRKLRHTWQVKIQQVAIRGIPDILVCLRGQFIALELKKDAKAKPDALQKVTLAKIVGAGGWAFTAFPENWSEVFSVLSLLSEGKAKSAGEAAGALLNELDLKEDHPEH